MKLTCRLIKARIIAAALAMCICLCACSVNESSSVAAETGSTSEPFAVSAEGESAVWQTDYPNTIRSVIEYQGPGWYDARPDPNEVMLEYGDKRTRIPDFTREDNITCVFANEAAAVAAWHSQYDDTDSIWVKTSSDQGDTWTLCEIPTIKTEKIEHLYASFDENGNGILAAECGENRAFFFRTSDVGQSWYHDESIASPDVDMFGIAAFTDVIWLYSYDELFSLQGDGNWAKVPLPEITEPYAEFHINRVRTEGKITVVEGSILPDEESPWQDAYFVSEDNRQTWHRYYRPEEETDPAL